MKKGKSPFKASVSFLFGEQNVQHVKIMCSIANLIYKSRIVVTTSFYNPTSTMIKSGPMMPYLDTVIHVILNNISALVFKYMDAYCHFYSYHCCFVYKILSNYYSTFVLIIVKN